MPDWKNCPISVHVNVSSCKLFRARAIIFENTSVWNDRDGHAEYANILFTLYCGKCLLNSPPKVSMKSYHNMKCVRAVTHVGLVLMD